VSDETPEWARPSVATDADAPEWAKTAAPAAPAAAESTPSNIDVVRNAMYKGAAAIPDALLNTPTNVINLGKAGVGSLADLAGRPDLAPDVTPSPNYVQRLLERIGLIKPGVNPKGFQKAADVLLQGATTGALTGGASLPQALAGAGMGALSSGAAESVAALGKKLGLSESQTNALSAALGIAVPAGASTLAGTLPRVATERGPEVPPERLKAYRDMTEKGARPSASSLIYGETNKNVKGQQRVANETWNEAVGLPKKSDFGLKEIDQARSNLSDDYQRLLTGREVTLDQPLFQRIKDLYDEQSKLASAGAIYSEARPIIDTLQKTMTASASGAAKIPALEYNKLRSILGRDAQRAKADPEKAGLLRKAQEALDDAADRSMPDIKEDLDTTRGRYENLMILSDAMVGKGPGFVTPAQIGREVAKRSGHRSLYPNQTPLKELGRQGLSLSGDAAIDGGVNVSGMALHAVPKTGISLTAIERALATPVTALRARGMGSKTFSDNAKAREAMLKEAVRRAIIPTAAQLQAAGEAEK